MKKKLTIEIENLTEAQASAIESFLASWEYYGNVGSSRWTRFYADGDGPFRPSITVNGEKPELKTELSSDGSYAIDSEELC